MDIRDSVAVVTGAASGLGLASAKKLLSQGAKVVMIDLPASSGATVAESLGADARFVAADVTDEAEMGEALRVARAMGPLRATIHCAGRGGPLRVLDKTGAPGSLATYEAIVRVNLIGTFNVLRLAAAAMAEAPEIAGERGVIVLTASVAAWEGQIGQIPYASAKAGIVGMTLVAARDLAQRKIRVCTIAPGVFDTPILARLGAEGKQALAQTVPHPARLGDVSEFAMLAAHIIENPMLNGETVRLDGALRMAAR